RRGPPGRRRDRGRRARRRARDPGDRRPRPADPAPQRRRGGGRRDPRGGGHRARSRGRLPPPDRAGPARQRGVTLSPLRIALLIAAKDLRQRFRDRSALIFAIIAPLGLALIFSRLIGPNAAFHATWAVVDLDGGAMATVLRDDVIGGVAKSGFADVTDIATEEAAQAAVRDGEVDAAFVIPQGF